MILTMAGGDVFEGQFENGTARRFAFIDSPISDTYRPNQVLRTEKEVMYSHAVTCGRASGEMANLGRWEL